jgi:integrase
MAKPVKLPSGNWRIRVYSHTDDTGKKIYKSFTDPDKKKVIKKAHEFQDSLEPKGIDREMTIAKAVDSYINSKDGVISPSTIRGYRTIQRNNFNEINSIYASRFTSQDAQFFIKGLVYDGLAPKTIKNIWALLQAALEQVTERRYKVTLPTIAPQEYNVPIDGEIKQLMSCANEDMKKIIALAAIGTLRRGEICALKYGDILTNKGALCVHADFVLNDKKEWVYKPFAKTKNSNRTVELPVALIEWLGNGPEDAFIFDGINPGMITGRFARLRAKVGINCRFHDLRHYSASIRSYLGFPQKEVMAVGGWSSPNVLQKVYDNQLKDKTNQYTQIANEYFKKHLLD